MVYYVIEKIEAVGGRLERRPIGVTTKKAEADKLNQEYCQGFECWIKENKRWLESRQLDPKEYFKNNPPALVAEWETDSIEDINFKQWHLQ